MSEETTTDAAAETSVADIDISGVKVYYSSMSYNLEVKNRQQRMIDILGSKRIPFQKIDIAKDKTGKNIMKRLCRTRKFEPPIITKADEYLGDFQAFMEAVDDEILEKFLKLS